MPGPPKDVCSLHFSAGERLLASGGADNTIKIWNPRAGELLATLVGHTSHIPSVTFNPDGLSLASASNDGTLRIWKRVDNYHFESTFVIPLSSNTR
jgi:WD40 repeat protein